LRFPHRSQDPLGSTDIFLHDSRQIVAPQDQAAVLDCNRIDVNNTTRDSGAADCAISCT
jgi:hypothetical protein